MQLTVSSLLNQFQRIMQGVLFPTLQEQLGPLSDKHQQLVAVLGLVGIEALVGPWSGGVGRPAKHRRAITRAFVAKAVLNLNSTAAVTGSSVGRCSFPDLADGTWEIEIAMACFATID
jgi:hypothetical protein